MAEGWLREKNGILGSPSFGNSEVGFYETYEVYTDNDRDQLERIHRGRHRH